MHYIGNLDTEKIEKYKEMISTNEVVLTDERNFHIYNNHTKDYGEIMKNLDRVVLYPDEILEDIKNKDTLFFIGKLGENNLNVIIKLSTRISNKHPKNSVMTAWIIRDSNLNKLRKKHKILYKSE